jgi:hypothetical protein
VTIPAYLRIANRYEHGTRARYSTGCRCDTCRAANTNYEKQRRARAKAAAEQAVVELVALAKPHGAIVRTYKRACPGVDGRRCPLQAYLRKDSVGGVCNRCRTRLVPSRLVPADAVREHILVLQRQGIGYKSIADASDVPRSVVRGIVTGKRKFIRARSAERVLAVDTDAIADSALVPAAETQRLLQELLDLGFTRTSLAARLGSTSETPSLQYKRDFVLARTALRVRRLHAMLTAGENDEDTFDVELRDDRPKARILRALRFFDVATSQELLEAMDVSHHERSTFDKALERLTKDGEIERIGERKPYQYRLAHAAERNKAA